MLRRLVNQEGIILFMATLGIAYFLDGLGQTIWGSDIYKINLGIPKEPMFFFEGVFPGGLLIDREEVVAAVVCAVLVAGLAIFFQVTRVGRALRAVADDHQAAQSVGIPLNTIWLIVWAVSGIVAIAAGMVWGSKLGVQFSISLVALKALPVLILGGFTSIPGAIVGGLIIGAGEKLAEVMLGPILIKMVRPRRRRHRELVRLHAGAGVPAVPAAGPVRRTHHRADLRGAPVSLPRSRPVQDLVPRRPGDLPDRAGPLVLSSLDRGLFGFLVISVHRRGRQYLYTEVLIPVLILSLAAIGLNILTGYCGQLSLGTGGFMAVGAYAAYNLLLRMPRDQPASWCSCSAA